MGSNSENRQEAGEAKKKRRSREAASEDRDISRAECQDERQSRESIPSGEHEHTRKDEDG